MRTIKGKQFVPLITKEVLDKKIKELALQLEKDFDGKDPLFVGVLNGSFMFLSELFKNIKMACEVSFVKVKSYQEMSSTGQVKELIGLSENIENRHVVIVEDIIDTGNTMKEILPAFHKQNPASISILTLLHKKAATVVPLKIDYVGFEVENKFVIGFGLDFDGLGRNIDEIMILAE
ncbi:hypoxanthine phosphoribosyltransferase [Arcticibacterium luteifluviistationis]|uniref:Hypoxanthine phosphoribosyltransferase n=1 Tax=Arcticibacterium luteifluviistationis TaxID=1784714 RepID=A0A2Z4GAV7_9BACT|nr:hypoxanthine phosphoribosyltransferase [Arcticibacterium luteifluviistationis]AWV98356.1 hypoxanthine phosphoribosyltransferase [Arcticibacterium luteifluviistationis]